MRFYSFKMATAAIAVAFALDASAAHAVELLSNTGFESGGGPANWTLTQSITGDPADQIFASELVDSADIGFQPPPGAGGLGLLIKSFAGNEGTYLGQNKAVNVTLTQTVAALAGKTFNFSGNSFFQVAAPNNLDTLFPDSPSGAIPSPTQTTFKVEFLDASNTVLAMNSVNLPKNRPTDVNPTDWVNTAMNGIVSPAGTTQARVTAAATNMVASCDEVNGTCTGGHDVYLDNFQLVQQGAFGGDLLATKNGNLNTVGAPSGYSIVKTAQDNISFNGDPLFAAHAGSVGMWLRAFLGGDAKLVSDPVAATPGAQYTFSAFSKWETGYGSLNPFPPAGQARTSTFMTIDFLNSTGTIIGTQSLDLCQDPSNTGCTLQQGDSVWRQFSMMATAPAGTAKVQIEAGATGMYDTGVNPQSAFFDDFSLMSNAAAGVPGDYNGDGVVNAADYVVWRSNLGSTTFTLPNRSPSNTGAISQADYTFWKSRFGATSGSGSGLGSGAVPEPATLGLLLIAMVGSVAVRRRAA